MKRKLSLLIATFLSLQTFLSQKPATLRQRSKWCRFPAAAFRWALAAMKSTNARCEVCVDSFEIGKYELTQAQWKAIMSSNASGFTSCGDNCPVDQISWHQAQEFLRKLNTEGKGTFRLPTEAEWGNTLVAAAARTKSGRVV